MHRTHAAIETISLWMARLGGLLLITISVMTSAEIIARKFFFIPFGVGTELSTYVLAVSASWSFSYALLSRAHVRIDVLRNCTGPRARAVLDLLALIALGALALVLARYVWDTVETTWSLGARENTPLATPLILPQGMWFVGLCWFALVCIEQVVLALAAFLRGDLAALARITAPSGLDEGITEALGAMDPRSSPKARV
jgi:TRAP-type mannitol/chloroaromatic compound transport system permease small subunit